MVWWYDIKRHKSSSLISVLFSWILNCTKNYITLKHIFILMHIYTHFLATATKAQLSQWYQNIIITNFNFTNHVTPCNAVPLIGTAANVVYEKILCYSISVNFPRWKTHRDIQGGKCECFWTVNKNWATVLLKVKQSESHLKRMRQVQIAQVVYAHSFVLCSRSARSARKLN